MGLKKNLLGKIKESVTHREEIYSQYATKNSEYVRREQLKKEEPYLRPPFYRDADRIIHSKAYARYIDKTQVFFLVDNDHVTHRVLHVQLVAKIARTIGRALRLNEDLIEAIALGHDIGHVPYGHFGEDILSELCKENGIGKFQHNVQSIQFLDTIENCDLTLQVLDGILCHNGEIVEKRILSPEGEKTWDSFNSKLEQVKEGKDKHPMTLEGCVVRVSDLIAYLGRDLQDALEVKIIENLDGFPQSCIETFDINDNWRRINWLVVDTLIRDVINNSFNENAIVFSEHVSSSIKDLYEFNMEHIYHNPKLKTEGDKIKRMYVIIFESFLADLEDENENSLIYADMKELDWISKKYRETATPSEMVRDYIAGMTDDISNTCLRKLQSQIGLRGDMNEKNSLYCWTAFLGIRAGIQ